MWFAASLAGLVDGPHAPALPLGRVLSRLPAGPAGRYALGLATGLLPCGLVYAALSIPVAVGGAFGGALAMVAFGMGTVPVLGGAAAIVRRFAIRVPAARLGMAAVVLVTGLGAIAARSQPAAADGTPACHEAPADPGAR